MTDIANSLNENTWAIMSIDNFQISSTDRCIRMIHLLLEDGITNIQLDFYPHMYYKLRESHHQRSYRFCKRHVHKLMYDPWIWPQIRYANAVSKINDFVVYNNVELILYYNNVIEKELCEELFVKSRNIEHVPKIQKSNSCNPRLITDWYYQQVLENIEAEYRNKTQYNFK